MLPSRSQQEPVFHTDHRKTGYLLDQLPESQEHLGLSSKVLMLSVTPQHEFRKQLQSPNHQAWGTTMKEMRNSKDSKPTSFPPWPLWKNTSLLLNVNFHGNRTSLVWKMNVMNLRQVSQNFVSGWNLFFLMFCARVVDFYCYHLITVVTAIVRINWACLLFPSQKTSNSPGHGGPTVLIVQQPNSQESLYKYSTVSGTGITGCKGWSETCHSLSLRVPDALVLSS